MLREAVYPEERRLPFVIEDSSLRESINSWKYKARANFKKTGVLTSFGKGLKEMLPVLEKGKAFEFFAVVCDQTRKLTNYEACML